MTRHMFDEHQRNKTSIRARQEREVASLQLRRGFGDERLLH